MKKVLTTVILCALLSLSLLPISAKPSAVLVMGDSIATGYGLVGYRGARPGEAVDSFGAKLAAEYGLTYGHTYYNFAVDGMTSAELAAALDGGKGWKYHKENSEDYALTDYQYSQYAVADSSAAQMAVKSCDTIVISIGGNDLLMPMFEVILEYIEANEKLLEMMGIDLDEMEAYDPSKLPEIMSGPGSDMMIKMLSALLTSDDAKAKFATGAEDFSNNISKITSSIYAVNPDADVYFLCLYNPFEGSERFADLADVADEFITQLTEGVNRELIVQSRSGNSFIPVSVQKEFAADTLANTNMLAYDIHPSASGHAIIFDALTEAIESPKSASGSAYSPSTFDAVTLAAFGAVGAVVGVCAAKRRR